MYVSIVYQCNHVCVCARACVCVGRGGVDVGGWVSETERQDRQTKGCKEEGVMGGGGGGAGKGGPSHKH